MERIDFSEFKHKVLENEEIREEYEALKPVYELRRKLIELRQKSGLTQAEVAEKLHTQKSNISRLENINTKNSPRISTIQEYANAMGYDVQIEFIPRQ
ncbi:MAG: helix-turn-helix transcriptional regulator [Spirochaetales bacterium]|nr:helix-turn-helix transcriptional regulator [Spirochaetales bacterium]